MKLSLVAVVIGVCILFGPQAAFALDCQRAWEAARAAAVQEGSADRVALIDAMLPIPVVNRNGDIICHSRIAEDLEHGDIKIFIAYGNDNKDLSAITSFMNRQRDGSTPAEFNATDWNAAGFILSFGDNNDQIRYNFGYVMDTRQDYINALTGMKDFIKKFNITYENIPKFSKYMYLNADMIRNTLADTYKYYRDNHMYNNLPPTEKAAVLDDEAAKKERKRQAAMPIFVGIPLTDEMRRLIYDGLSGTARVGYALCDIADGERCTKVTVFCVKPRQLSEVDGLNGILEKKSMGIDVIFRDNDGKFNFGLRRAEFQRWKSGWKLQYIGDAYANNCRGLD